MADREKVLKGLECCILRNPDDHARCSQCPYGSNCVNRLKMDALNLLKEQQEIIDELNAAIKEWRNLKWFTPYEVGIAMVTRKEAVRTKSQKAGKREAERKSARQLVGS